MMSKSGLFITIVVITIGIVDLAFVCFGGTGSSVSNFLVTAGIKSPIFCFSAGFVCGHIFGKFTPVPLK